MMLERLDVSYAKPPPPPAVTGDATQSRRLRRGDPPGMRKPAPRRQPELPHTELDRLQECLQFSASQQDRAHLQQVIAREGLLAPAPLDRQATTERGSTACCSS